MINILIYTLKLLWWLKSGVIPDSPFLSTLSLAVALLRLMLEGVNELGCLYDLAGIWACSLGGEAGLFGWFLGILLIIFEFLCALTEILVGVTVRGSSWAFYGGFLGEPRQIPHRSHSPCRFRWGLCFQYCIVSRILFQLHLELRILPLHIFHFLLHGLNSSHFSLLFQ